MLNTPKFWQSINIISLTLYPLTWVYRVLLKLDKLKKSHKSYKSTVTVVSVGNITVGGSGKTPVVELLAKHYTSQGETVAIISRGFGVNNESKLVTASDTAATVGDEPKMLFNANVAEQIWVGQNRVKSLKQAEAKGATVAILDDGMQHWIIERDIDILVVNGTYGLGNKLCLPAGPLREPLSAIKRSKFAIVVNGELDLPIPTINAVRAHSPNSITALKNKRTLAFCGLGLPEQFFASLKDAGINLVETITFPDHHNYSAKDIAHLKAKAAEHNAVLATTQKDAVKLAELDVTVVAPEFTKESSEKIIEQL